MCDKPGKICTVCGDKAIGRNFGAITCESCKTFFRRALIKNKMPMKCYFGNQCEINALNRKLCRRCRLDKCIRIGMRKELITKRNSDGDNSIEQNSKNAFPSGPDSSQDSVAIPESIPDFVSEELSFNDFIDSLTDKQMTEELNEWEEYLKDRSESVKTSTIVLPVVRPMTPFDKQLNDMEHSRLNELTLAGTHYQDYNDCTVENYIECNDLGALYEFYSSLNLFDEQVLSTIKFCKSMTMFNDMCEDDKLILVKASCWKMVCLKYIAAVKLDNYYWTMNISNDSCIRGSLAKMKEEDEELFNLGVKYYDESHRWLSDSNLVHLLMALVLFQCQCELHNLNHQSTIILNQNIYYYLLQRYLRQKFGSEDNSSEALLKAMEIINGLKSYMEIEYRLAKRFSRTLTPLIKEVLDI